MNSIDLPIKKRSCASRVYARERIVWAKLAGYKHWPARIIPDKLRASNPNYRQADSHRRKCDDTLVHFFGTDDLAWVNGKKAVVAWEEGMHLRYHRLKVTSKNDSKQFIAAVDQVENFCSKRRDYSSLYAEERDFS